MGNVHKSYVKNNAIWRAFNRAIALSATNYLDISNNVIYRAMGHNIYFKFGNEVKNIVKDNLIVDVRQ